MYSRRKKHLILIAPTLIVLLPTRFATGAVGKRRGYMEPLLLG